MSVTLINEICGGIEAGLSIKQAAISAGVSESTFHRWKVKGGKAKVGIFREFWERLKKAEIKIRKKHLDRIDRAAAGRQTSIEKRVKRDGEGNVVEKTVISKVLAPQWQASAWILERKFPGEFGRNATPQDNEGKDPFDRWLEDLREAEAEFGGQEYPIEDELEQ
jgi:hypothetical protein